MVQENTSEDKEDDDEEDDDDEEKGGGDAVDGTVGETNEKRTKALSDDATNQNPDNEKSLPFYGKH